MGNQPVYSLCIQWQIYVALTSKENAHKHTHACADSTVDGTVTRQTHPLGGAQKFPGRKAGHRNSGNNWVSERSLDSWRFLILCRCWLNWCRVFGFTGQGNNSPSGSPSSFVDKKTSWHAWLQDRPTNGKPRWMAYSLFIQTFWESKGLFWRFPDKHIWCQKEPGRIKLYRAL